MNLHHPIRGSVRVWLTVSVPLFIAAWFLPIGKDADTPAGALWWTFLTHDYFCSFGEMLGGLLVLTFIFSAVTGLVGWILQFPLCAAWDYFKRAKTRDEKRVA